MIADVRFPGFFFIWSQETIQPLVLAFAVSRAVWLPAVAVMGFFMEEERLNG